MSSCGVTEILDAVLSLIPLDTYAKFNTFLMEKVQGDEVAVPIWIEYEKIAIKHELSKVRFRKLERFEFYERAKKAFAIIATGEKALYANIILKKGVL